MSAGPDATPTLAASADAEKNWWAVAVVLLKQGRSGVVKILLRHGLWLADTKDTAVGAAVSEALGENPGWALHLVNATGMPPNAQGSPTAITKGEHGHAD